MPAGRPPTRPSVDDAEAVERVCDLLIQGHSMVSACAPLTSPSETAVYMKMAKDPEFRGIITRAREAQQEAIIDQTVDMADAATPEDWQVVRMRIWARQWRAGKLAPKVYGDKVHQTVTGPNDGPVQVQHLDDRPPIEEYLAEFRSKSE